MADPPVKVEVHGTAELAAGSRKLFERIDEAAVREFQSTADQVAALVRGRQPVLTGRLAASAGSETTAHGASVTLGDGVPYAGWIEFGGTHGRSYVPEGRTVYPSAEESTNAFARAGDKAARKQIGAMSWPSPSRL